MSVRLSLLAILDQAPCYGNQLKAEFERRTAGTWPVNVGQIYQTLDRLVRDKLVTERAPNEQGNVVYAITDAGRAQVRDWFTQPVPRPRDEFAAKLALAASLPGVDATALLAAQERAARSAADMPTPGDPVGELLHGAARAAARAELQWLQSARDAVRGIPAQPIDAEPPRRGRPANRRITPL